jgi:chorismate mutase
MASILVEAMFYGPAVAVKRSLAYEGRTRNGEYAMTAVEPELQQLRDSIDNIDAALIHLLAERFKCTKRVGEFKATHGLPPADPGREAEQIARLRVLADNAKLDPDFAEKFLNFIVREVIRHHEAIRQNK